MVERTSGSGIPNYAYNFELNRGEFLLGHKDHKRISAEILAGPSQFQLHRSGRKGGF